MSTRVSILLPTYNRPDVLPLAINSILAQTFDDYELLVVGDGCAESTEQSIKGFRDSRIRWFDLPKAAGVGYANRNIALREARGEIIAYQSHDDLWLPDHLELLVRLMDNKKSEFAYSRPLDVSTGGVITPVSFNLHDPLTFENWVKRGIGYVPIAAVIHRRDCLAKYGYWNEDLLKGGDWELWARIIQGGAFQNFSYSPTPTSFHFVASWRKESFRKRIQLKVRNWEGSIQPALRVPLRDTELEQEALWRLISQEPGWVDCLRTAAQVELDRRNTGYFFWSELLRLVRNRQLRLSRTLSRRRLG